MAGGEFEKATRLPLRLRKADPDCWSDVRDLHATSLRRVSGPALDIEQIEAFLTQIYSPDYTSALQSQSLHTAWFERQLVATAGWIPADDAGLSARITAVFVSPLYLRMGVGRHIVTAVEAEAAAAGFQAFSARVLPPALPFFEALGYTRSSLGVFSVGTENGVPVVFMRKDRQIAAVPAGRTAERAR